MHDYPAPPAKHFHVHFSPLGSIIKLPPKPGKDVPYPELVCSEQDKANIIEIITTLADNSKFSLLLQQSHIKNLGAQINHVHPYKFLVVAISSPQLKSSLALIFEDYFKRNGFMDGISARLAIESEKGTLDHYLAAFADEIKIPVENIQMYLQSKDWEGLIRFLMNS